MSTTDKGQTDAEDILSETPKLKKKTQVEISEPPKTETEIELPKTETEIEPPKTETEIEPPKTETEIEPPKTEIEIELPKTETEIEPPKTETEIELPKTETEIEPPKTETEIEPPKTETEIELSKTEEQPSSQRQLNIVFIGIKPVLTYVTATLTQLASEPTVTIKARGKRITQAVDVSQMIVKRMNAVGYKISGVRIASDSLTSQDGKQRNVSSIEIDITK
ncbi:MAG: DNA/RNA-binding protein Alba [Marine Group I thaumarchaeote]|nr:MAG: DNA/RNA-binding protein Alba [Marine Group I thaumarchaeote]